METVEINAGAWYLRGLRDDDRVTDVPALAETGLLWGDTDGAVSGAAARFVVDAAGWWDVGSRFVWAVCEPTTGELVALIGVRPVDPGGAEGDACAELIGRRRPGAGEALDVGVAAVTRFVEGALDLRVTAVDTAS